MVQSLESLGLSRRVVSPVLIPNEELIKEYIYQLSELDLASLLSLLSFPLKKDPGITGSQSTSSLHSIL